jgi:hypothetical protein
MSSTFESIVAVLVIFPGVFGDFVGVLIGKELFVVSENGVPLTLLDDSLVR